MTQKTQPLAVAIVHGMGRQPSTFADKTENMLKEAFAKHITSHTDAPEQELVVKPVYWAPVMQEDEDTLESRIREGGPVDYERARGFVVDVLGDAIAYQPSKSKEGKYAGIHRVFAKVFKELAEEAGAQAPLCVIAHSLGASMSSNYIYDLQHNQEENEEGKKVVLIPESVLMEMGSTPLERAETLTHFYTAGSTLALWSLRHKNFGTPVQVPAKQSAHMGGEWINFYDRDDILGYPLRTLNEEYKDAVKDVELNVGGLIGFTPASHVFYLEDSTVIDTMAQSLAQTWKAVNNIT